MTPDDWNSGVKSVVVFLNGEAIPEPDTRGERIVDDSFLLCFNAHDHPVEFVVPDGQYAREWTTVIDTFDPEGCGVAIAADAAMMVPGHTLVVLRKSG